MGQEERIGSSSRTSDRGRMRDASTERYWQGKSECEVSKYSGHFLARTKWNSLRGGRRKGKGPAQERMVVVRRATYPRKGIDEEIPYLKSRKYRASRLRERSKTVSEEWGMVAQPILGQFRWSQHLWKGINQGFPVVEKPFIDRCSSPQDIRPSVSLFVHFSFWETFCRGHQIWINQWMLEKDQKILHICIVIPPIYPIFL